MARFSWLSRRVLNRGCERRDKTHSIRHRRSLFESLESRHLLAAASPLDFSFNSGGTLVSNITGKENFGDMALTNNGSIVVAGVSDANVLVAKYTSTGAVDSAFATGGKFIKNIDTDVPLGLTSGRVTGVAIQPDGKILVTGWGEKISLTTAPVVQSFVLRLNANGSRDDSFDTDGALAFEFAGSPADSRASDIAFTAANGVSRIVVGGTATTLTSFDKDFALKVFKLDGTPDTSFGTAGSGGSVSYDLSDLGNSVDQLNRILVQPDGAILMAGESNNPVVVRVKSNGVRDTLFGNNGGVVIESNRPRLSGANAIALQEDGNIVVAVSSFEPALAFARIDGVNGEIDLSIGDSGFQYVGASHPNGFSARSLDIAVQTNGRILLSGAGFSSSTSENGVLAARFNPDGSLDTEFGSSGIVFAPIPTVDYFESNFLQFSSLIQPDGNVLIGGTGYINSPFSSVIAIARLVGDTGPLPLAMVSRTSFSSSGVVAAGSTSLSVSFNIPVKNAGLIASYELRRAGANHLLENSDPVITLSGVKYGSQTATITVPALTEDVYRLTVKDGITSTDARKLDGDGNNTVGGNDSLDFVVDGPSRITLVTPASPALNIDRSSQIYSKHSFSDDGKYFVFYSNASDLVAGDTNGKADVFRKNLMTGAIEIVSRTSTTLGDSDSFAPAISGDGRFVVFQSYASNFASDDTLTNPFGSSFADIFLKDMVTGAITLVSRTASGAPGNGDSVQPDISRDATKIVFNTGAINIAGGANRVVVKSVSDLTTAPFSGTGNGAILNSIVGNNAAISGDGNTIAYLDVGGLSLMNLSTNGVTVVSINGSEPSLNHDGTKLAFSEYENALFLTNIRLYDRLTTSAITVSTDRTGKTGLSDSFTPTISADGRYVAFYSGGALVDGDTNSTSDVFVKDTLTGTIVRASVTQSGAQVDLGGFTPTISPDGRRVAFTSRANNFVPNDFNRASDDLFVATIPLTLSSPGSPSGAMFDPDISSGGYGQLVQGSANAFDGLNRLIVGGTLFSSSNSPTITNNGQTMRSPTISIAGLNVSREVTALTAGADRIRTIEVLTNPSATTPVTTTIRLVGNLGSNFTTQPIGSSNSDTTFQINDQWFATDDDQPHGGVPTIVHSIHGPAGLVPTFVRVLEDNIEWTYSVNVPAGATVRLAGFTSLAQARTTAIGAVNDISDMSGLLSAEAAEFMTPTEVSSILNYAINGNQTPTNIILSKSNVNENVIAGSVIGTFTSSDLNPLDTHTYSLVTGTGSTDNANFLISGNQLKINTIPDFEVKNSYSIRVRTTDSGAPGLTFEKSFTITINDVNEPAKVTLTNVLSRLPEDTFFNDRFKVANIQITNDALGTNAVTLSGIGASKFEILSGQLFIKAGTVLNATTQPILDVSVNVDDTTIPGTPDAAAPYSLRVTAPIRFDFNTTNYHPSHNQSGYLPVTPASLYAPGIQSYGWRSTSGLSGDVYNVPAGTLLDVIDIDTNLGTDNTFRIDLPGVPDGRSVTVTLGLGSIGLSHRMEIRSSVAILNDLRTTPTNHKDYTQKNGGPIQRTLSARVSNGGIDIRLIGLGGLKFAINSLNVNFATDNLSVAPLAPIIAGSTGTTIVASRSSSLSAFNGITQRLVTISADHNAVIVASDVDLNRAGIQVFADSSGRVSFGLKNSYAGTSFVAMDSVDGSIRGSFFANFTTPTISTKLDFQSSNMRGLSGLVSGLASGYSVVVPGTIFNSNSEASRFGWDRWGVKGVTGNAFGFTTNDDLLRRDGHQVIRNRGEFAVFSMRVDPFAPSVQVKVHLQSPHGFISGHQYIVKIGDQQQTINLNPSNAFLPPRHATLFFNVFASDYINGILRVQFANTDSAFNGTRDIIVNGIEIATPQRIDLTVPLPAGKVETVSQVEVERLLEVAKDRWRAVIPNAVFNIHAVVLNFGNSTDELATYEGPIIRVDDDALGRGWFVDPTPRIDEEFMRTSVTGELKAKSDAKSKGRIDLLSVLMHELGHSLGLADLPDKPNSLMSSTITDSVRRLPQPTPKSVDNYFSKLGANL